MTARPIYLDSFSTTVLAPEALEAMKSVWSEPGNASSPHGAGQRALAALERGRMQVANLIGCLPGEVVFTSGATEANNLALRGVADWARRGGTHRRRVIVSAIEHKAVLESAKHLTLDGFEMVIAPVDGFGVVNMERLDELIDDNTLLVSIMLVNNETGVIEPLRKVRDLARPRGALLHCDAAQAAGKLPLDVIELGVDYLSVSAHKLYGPMGVGALYVASDAPKPIAQAFGGGQERGMRSGTEPIPLIAGFGTAAEVAQRSMADDERRAAGLVNEFLQTLKNLDVSCRRITGTAPVVTGGLALSFPGVSADDLVGKVSPYLHISTGSACSSGQISPSHVLTSMGLSRDDASSVVRFYFSRFTTHQDVLDSAAILARALAAAVSPLDDPASPRYDAPHETCAHRP